MKTLGAPKSIEVRYEERACGGMRYEYRLSISESRKTASFGLRLYSVSVKLTDRRGVETEATLNEAFCDSERAFRFFNRIVENLATPIDLPYVFDDEYTR
jgi:hypothetical protein